MKGGNAMTINEQIRIKNIAAKKIQTILGNMVKKIDREIDVKPFIDNENYLYGVDIRLL